MSEPKPERTIWLVAGEDSGDQLGAKLGIDRSSVSNLVGLLALPADVQEFVRSGQVSLGHAKVLKGAGGAAAQSAWCKRVVMDGLSVAALDAAMDPRRDFAHVDAIYERVFTEE